MSDMTKVTVTNTSDGPKIFNSSPAIILQGGEATDGEVEISAAELESMTGLGHFEIKQSKAAKGSDKPAA